MSAFDTGPFVGAAFFCETVLTENSGSEVHSYIRVVDTMQVVAKGGDAERMEDALQKLAGDLTLVVMLRAGETRGSFKVVVVHEKPSGQRENTPIDIQVHFPAGPTGIMNLHMGVAFDAAQEGLHWFDVFGGEDQRLLTRVPLTVQVSRLRR